MVESELVICHLRHQVRHLQSLLNYLEGREAMEQKDYSYANAKLREVIGRLREMERFSSERGRTHRLIAEWMN